MPKHNVGDLLYHPTAGMGLVVQHQVGDEYNYLTWWSGVLGGSGFTVAANAWNIDGWKAHLAQYMKENWDAKAKAHQ